MEKRAPDVVVVGGGVIGLAIAHAARASGAEVTVVDDQPGSGASAVAAGMLAPVTEVHYGEESLLRLNLASARLYPEWIESLEEETGLSTGYRRAGTLLVARDRDDNEALSELHRFQISLGLEVERLTSSALREIEPGLAPGVRGGILVPGDNQIDPQALVEVLLTACEKSGVSFIRERCTALPFEGDRVKGVATSEQEVPAGVVVLATGADSARIAGAPRELLNVRPVKGQLVRLRSHDVPVPISRAVRGLDVYLVPRVDGTLVVGATVEERSDRHVTAGAVHDLLRYAYELCPGVTELEFSSAVTGLRPGTPDNAPLIGPAGADGLFIATGHYRNGVLLAPATARFFAKWLDSGTMPDGSEPFDPARFGDAA